MKNRIINLIIASPVTLTLLFAILYKASPNIPLWAVVLYGFLILLIAERAGFIYDHFKSQS